ncbi:XkdF-like putative serine protease domain-containing protein [Mucilaginibacter pedocola]|uniref:Phage-like element PBSX protein XkdF domain-containing protein n=1 Tax=Mucilaginibacter pedocola TaxID=1792845 RepID=A0A1S9P968_9SPHI|nr:XkdF-like putative serine protease domain-containing protein [Mucilaginibacter pedocola]OOQ57148.1 hypothetical protein BC343_16645 [Mucilaginibacter pedocola]
MNLKIYKCCIDDTFDSELEVSFVALVDRPAIEKNFLAFAEKARFAVNEDKRIISGPAMLADIPIYRKDDALGEYYVQFDRETITAIVQKFFKKGFIQNFNLFHNPGRQLSGVTIFESFITDSNRGIMPMKGFEGSADGSWFISAKVDDDDTWARIKSGELRGFSVEGIFQYVKMNANDIKRSPEQTLEIIMKLLNETQATN